LKIYIYIINKNNKHKITHWFIMFHDVNKIYILNKREYIIYKRIKKKKKKYIYRIYKVLKLYFIIIFLKKKKKKKKKI